VFWQASVKPSLLATLLATLLLRWPQARGSKNYVTPAEGTADH